MRKNKYSLFDHWWRSNDFRSVSQRILLVLSLPIWVARVALFGVLLQLALIQLASLPRALEQVIRAFREAEALGQTDNDSTQLKGGERNAGSRRKGFLIRPGGSLNSDDLRRRLYELRTSKMKGNIDARQK